MNIAAALQRQAQLRPQAIAIREPCGGGKYQSLTFGELWDRVARIAAALPARGIGPGTRAALMVPPSIAFVELTFALFTARAVPVFVDPGIGLQHLKACLAEAEPAAFVGITKAHVARLLFGWAKSSLKSLVTAGPRLIWGGTTLDQLRREAARDVSDSLEATQIDDVAAILFTSGSTGVPKGAVYTHGMFNAQLAALRDVFHIEPGEVDLCTFPLFALFGPALGMTSIIPVMDSTKPALVPPQNIVNPAQQFQATNLFGSPALLNRVSRGVDAAHRLAEHLGQSEEECERATRMPSLQRVLSAGAPVSPAILERFSKLLSPGTQIYTPYGATEALPVAVIGSDDVLRETRHQTVTGAGTCVGRLVPGLEVRILRISDGPIATMSADLVLPPGEVGEIAVFGPQVTQEYFRRPDLTALAKIADPERGRMWHRMGDVGYFDEQGRLWFCGRKSQRVVTAERTHFTEPVEGVFNAHPAVFRTALVGVKRDGVMEPVLCVELEKSAKPQASADITRELLSLGQQHEPARAIRTILYHPAFPVDIRHNSKIFREKLAVWAADRLR
jgi:acyl-CoA synthetase (AMP-forming)/AMP-acid ligase II